jgi:hypothetical protein
LFSSFLSFFSFSIGFEAPVLQTCFFLKKKGRTDVRELAPLGFRFFLLKETYQLKADVTSGINLPEIYPKTAYKGWKAVEKACEFLGLERIYSGQALNN